MLKFNYDEHKSSKEETKIWWVIKITTLSQKHGQKTKKLLSLENENIN
jgi:hypothetical protein